MNEIVWRFSVCKGTHDFDTFIQFLSRGRFMEYRSLEVRDVNVFVWSSEAPSSISDVQCILRNLAVYFEDHLWCKRLLLQFYDATHGHIVVNYHSLTPVARWTSFSQHLLRHFACCCSTLQL